MTRNVGDERGGGRNRMGQRSGTRMIRPEYDPDIRLLSLSVVSVFRAWTKQDLETIYRIRLFSPLVYPVRYFLFFSPPILFTFSPVYLSIYLHFFRVFIYIFPASRSSYVAAIFTQGSRDGETRSIDGDTRRPGNEDEEGLREFTVSDSKMIEREYLSIRALSRFEFVSRSTRYRICLWTGRHAYKEYKEVEKRATELGYGSGS